MPNTINYVQGRFLDYYTSNNFRFESLFESDDIEWGYSTRNGEMYRHFSSTEIASSISDMKENDGFGVYHSLSEYEDPSEFNYTDKEISKGRVSIRLSTRSTVPTTEEWKTLIDAVKNTKSIIETEFPVEFKIIRTSLNTLHLVSDTISLENPNNLYSRLESYVTPHKLDSFDITSIKGTGNGTIQTRSDPDSRLGKDVKIHVRDKYVNLRERAIESLDGTDINGYGSIEDEGFPEVDEEFYDILDELQEIDMIAATKSFQFIQSLVDQEEDELTGEYLTNTTFNCKRVSEYFANEYLSSEWLGDRETVRIQVVDLHGMIPCDGSLSTHGGFYVHEVGLDDIPLVPKSYFSEFYEENQIKISLNEDYLSVIGELDLPVKETTETQKVSEDVGIFLLSSGLANKESEF